MSITDWQLIVEKVERCSEGWQTKVMSRERGVAIDASGIGPFDNPLIPTLNFQGASKNWKVPR